MEAKIKAYSKKELCALYNISYRVLKVWLTPFKNKIGKYKGLKYTPAQVKIIFEVLGEP